MGADIAFRQTLGVPATNAGIARLADDARLLGATEDEAHYLEAIMLDLAGMPQASMRNPEGWWPRVSAAGRNLAYITFGGLFGLASMAESSVVVAKQGLLGTFGVIPDLAKVRRSALDGRLSNEFLDYQLGYTGLGADSFIRPAGVKGTRFEADTGQFVTARTGVERALEKGRNFVARASGLQGITEWQRRQMPIHILAEFESVLMRGKKLSGGVGKRFAAMGYDEAGLKELKAAMDRFGVDITNHGRTIRRADLERWAAEDPKTHARFQRAIMRETEKAIIDVSVGKQPPWLNTEAGKIFGQFMGFTLHSYNTHLMRGLNLHDWQTAVNAMTSMFIAASVGTAINYARYHNDPTKLEEKLSLSGMAKWGFARSTFGGIPSMAVDNLMAAGGWDGFFNTRYSSLDSKAFSLDSTPAISLGNRFWEVGQRALQIGIGQKAVSGSDAKALVRTTPLTLFPSIQRGTQNLFAEVLGVPFEDLR